MRGGSARLSVVGSGAKLSKLHELSLGSQYTNSKLHNNPTQ